jgi:osmoprotectant transport system substrate-binding protein
VAGNSTDGLIAALDLVALEDDKHYFPPYYAAPVARRSVLERHPGIRRALGDLGGKISEGEMRRLNYAVEGEGRELREVVREFRRSKGL